jgi:hypothetical protein
LGTDDIERARSDMEDPLRMTVPLIMSTPEYPGQEEGIDVRISLADLIRGSD